MSMTLHTQRLASSTCEVTNANGMMVTSQVRFHGKLDGSSLAQAIQFALGPRAVLSKLQANTPVSSRCSWGSPQTHTHTHTQHVPR